MDDLNKMRNDIDKIDAEITKLFEERMNCVLKVAEYKEKNNIPVLHSSREEDVIKRNAAILKDIHFKKYLIEFFYNLLYISRKLQKDRIKDTQIISKPNEQEIIGYQGIKGSFSEEALIKYFGTEVKTINFSYFKDVFDALKDSKINYGVLPLENSSTGGVSDVYDLLREYGYYIVGEVSIKVDHNLLGVKNTTLSDIKEVYSHPQGLQQCSKFFQNYPEIILVPYTNTAASAEYVSKLGKKEKACIASKRAANLYGLDIIESEINYNKNNHTRFVIINKTMNVTDECNKISIVFSIPHKPGALYDILKYFAKNNLNLLKIESRPILQTPWEYYFYLDFEGNIKDPNIKEALEGFKNNCTDFKILGNYINHNI